MVTQWMFYVTKVGRTICRCTLCVRACECVFFRDIPHNTRDKHWAQLVSTHTFVHTRQVVGYSVTHANRTTPTTKKKPCESNEYNRFRYISSHIRCAGRCLLIDLDTAPAKRTRGPYTQQINYARRKRAAQNRSTFRVPAHPSISTGAAAKTTGGKKNPCVEGEGGVYRPTSLAHARARTFVNKRQPGRTVSPSSFARVTSSCQIGVITSCEGAYT